MKKKMKRFLLLLIIILISLSSACTLLSGNSRRWKPVKSGKQAFVHIVKWSDETFIIISKWYTGSAEHSEDLINANPTVNPEQLYIGNKIFIPGALLRTKKALSREYVEKFYKTPVKESKKKANKPEKKPVEKDEFELFGPR